MEAIQFYLKETGWENINMVEEFDHPDEVVELMQKFAKLKIEEAFNAGQRYGVYIQGGSYDKKDDVDFEDYIKSVKL